MSMFENYDAETAAIERELQRKGVALGIDWANDAQLRELARDALDYHAQPDDCAPLNPEHAARCEIYGLAQLMLRVMQDSASEDHVLSHGGSAWKALARALWAEYRARNGEA